MSAAPTAAVELIDVHKSYRLGPRRVHALRGVSLRLDRPGFFAIMGASGSGKSTLLHLLAGLDRPDAGEVRVAGHALHSAGEKELTRFRRHAVGMVFQQFNLIPTLNALQNAALPAMLDGMATGERDRRATELLEALGLGPRMHHRPDALSGGEQQRVAIARALMFSPTVLLADEPTGNLDSESSETLWRLLGSLAAERAMTVVMVTHEPAAASHCERMFVLRDGRIEGTMHVEGMDSAELATRYQQLLRSTHADDAADHRGGAGDEHGRRADHDDRIRASGG